MTKADINEDLIRRMREHKFYDLTQWCAEELEEVEYLAEQYGYWPIAKELRAEINHQKSFY